jgi:hypothetical protein
MSAAEDSAAITAIRQQMAEDLGRLERQRKRVTKLQHEDGWAVDAKELLDTMERAYAIKEIYLDLLLGAESRPDAAGVLQPYDIEQRAIRFGVSGAALRQAVADAGPQTYLVETAIAPSRSKAAAVGASVNGPPSPRRGRHRT